MNLKRCADLLNSGFTVVFDPRGNSMSPLITDGQRVTVEPVNDPLKVDDIVLAKVRSRYYLHKVTALDKNRVQIGNNHGRINGWTIRKKVYGIVTEVA